MNLFADEPTSRIGLTLNLPADFRTPLGGQHETVIDVHAMTPTSQSTEVGSWRYASIVESPWTFWFKHNYTTNIGIKYRIRIQFFHDSKPLLLQQDHLIIVNNTPHREILHLSPIGQVYVRVEEPRDIPAEEAVMVRLHEVDSPEMEIARATQDEQGATSFYLKYDPDNVVPGKHYSLTGTDNRYGRELSVTPGLVQLAPE